MIETHFAEEMEKLAGLPRAVRDGGGGGVGGLMRRKHDIGKGVAKIKAVIGNVVDLREPSGRFNSADPAWLRSAGLSIAEHNVERGQKAKASLDRLLRAKARPKRDWKLPPARKGGTVTSFLDEVFGARVIPFKKP